MSPRLRLLLPLAALALVASGNTPVQREGAVTYTTSAKRADLVVQEIAAQTGLQLATTDDAKLHYLIIAVTDADAETVLAKIAKVTSSKWETVGEKRTLLPDDAVRKQERADRDEKRIAEFKEAQATFKKRLDAKPIDYEKLGEDEELPESTVYPYDIPAEKALAQLALLIDPREAARISDNGRLVFSTLPNRMQRSMTSAQATRILNTLVVDHNKWAAEQIKSEEEQKKEMLGSEEMAQYMAMFGQQLPTRLFDGPPAKALLVLETSGELFGFDTGSPQVELKVYDKNGTIVAQASLQINNRFAQMADSIEMGPDGELVEKKKEDSKEQQAAILPEDRVIVEFSDKTKALSSLQSMEEMSFNMPDALLAVLRDPIANDPLGFHHSDILLAIAKAKKLNVVANMSDSDMSDVFSMGPAQEGVSVGQAYSGLVAEGSAKVENKDGWLTLSPTDPIKSRESRQDRAILKQFIDTVLREGSTSLDALSLFALNSPPPMENGTSMLYLLAFAPSTLQGIMGDTMDWPMLRFYGTLMPQQKASLRQGGRIPFGTLAQRSRDVLTKMAFGSKANIKPAAKMLDQNKLPFFMEMMGGMFGGGQPKDFTEEPTEVMPNGLPNDGYLDLNLAVEPIAKPEGARSMIFIMFGSLGADEFALFELMKDSSAGEMAEVGDMFAMPDKVKIGSREKMNFHFWLSPAAGIVKTLIDDTVPKDAATVSMADLPPAFKALIAQRKQAIKDSPFGKMMGGIGNMP